MYVCMYVCIVVCIVVCMYSCILSLCSYHWFVIYYHWMLDVYGVHSDLAEENHLRVRGSTQRGGKGVRRGSESVRGRAMVTLRVR